MTSSACTIQCLFRESIGADCRRQAGIAWESWPIGPTAKSAAWQSR
jgi:hypothetical protein